MTELGKELIDAIEEAIDKRLYTLTPSPLKNISIKHVFYDYYGDFSRKATYIINALSYNDIYCVGDLLELSEKEFKRCPRIGTKTFNFIMDYLNENNLSLRKE